MTQIAFFAAGRSGSEPDHRVRYDDPIQDYERKIAKALTIPKRNRNMHDVNNPTFAKRRRMWATLSCQPRALAYSLGA